MTISLSHINTIIKFRLAAYDQHSRDQEECRKFDGNRKGATDPDYIFEQPFGGEPLLFEIDDKRSRRHPKHRHANRKERDDTRI
jgi:hypothetical protein